MMHHQDSCIGCARVVEAVDRLARDEEEGAGRSRVAVVADPQDHLACEDIDELVAAAMIVRPGTYRPGRHSSFPDGAQATGFGFRRFDRYARPSRPDSNEPAVTGCHN